MAITVMYAGYYAPEHAARAIAGMGLTNGLGQIIATHSGGLAADAWGWRAPFVLSVGAGALGVLLMALCREVCGPARGGGSLTLRRMWEVGTSRTLLIVSTLSSLNTYATFTTVFGFIPVFARDLGASRAQLGLLTAVSLIPFTLAQPIAARLTERIGFRSTGLLSCGSALMAQVTLQPRYPAAAVTPGRGS